jgi:hypothetical protein
MPLYLFQHPETREVKEILQKMSEEHTYSEEGVDWDRLFTIPNTAIDSQYDCDNSDSFIKNTNKKMTIGEMWDESASQGQNRIDKHGYDPVKEKTVKKYEKKTGKLHPDSTSKDVNITI